MTEETFPPGFPPELAAHSFTAGSEAAWPLDSVSAVVKWLGENRFAVLGTELWIVRRDGIQPGVFVNGMGEIHGNGISSQMQNESWDTYVTRCAEETLRYLNSFAAPPEAKQQGRVFFNVTWVCESGYSNLSARI